MELLAVAELIRDQTPMVRPEPSEEPTLQARQRAMLIWGLIMTFGAAAVGASLKILGKEGIHPAGEFTPYLSVIAVVAAIFGMGLMCYPFLQQTWGKPISRKPPLPEPDPTIKLRPALLSEEHPSVTEFTTEFLEASEARAKAPDTAPQNE
ncbi:MAG TPA: hypothetical protein VK651_05540 [Blastocatellia bacterium]|nr:hypothetical protein [Blastocatellia bacterium]